MDLTKIGRFIAELRKEMGITQEQLGDMIGVTNKTVSRWETGTYLPPADALMRLSALFKVSINELLSGQRLAAEEYQAAAEKNFQNVIPVSRFSLEERIRFYQEKWLKDHTAVLILIGIVVLAAYLMGIMMRNVFVICLANICLIIAHGWRNNTMMSYVEDRAFDGTGC